MKIAHVDYVGAQFSQKPVEEFLDRRTIPFFARRD
jgi:hypothetical protein